MVFHVFTKFINCAVGSVYLAVNHKNYKAIKFYNKMNMTRISNTKLDYLAQTNYSKGYIYKATKEYLEGIIH